MFYRDIGVGDPPDVSVHQSAKTETGHEPQSPDLSSVFDTSVHDLSQATAITEPEVPPQQHIQVSTLASSLPRLPTRVRFTREQTREVK